MIVSDGQDKLVPSLRKCFLQDLTFRICLESSAIVFSDSDDSRYSMVSAFFFLEMLRYIKCTDWTRTIEEQKLGQFCCVNESRNKIPSCSFKDYSPIIVPAMSFLHVSWHFPSLQRSLYCLHRTLQTSYIWYISVHLLGFPCVGDCRSNRRLWQQTQNRNAALCLTGNISFPSGISQRCKTAIRWQAHAFLLRHTQSRRHIAVRVEIKMRCIALYKKSKLMIPTYRVVLDFRSLFAGVTFASK